MYDTIYDMFTSTSLVHTHHCMYFDFFVGPNIPVAVGVSISVVLLIVMTVAVACLVYHKDKLKE